MSRISSTFARLLASGRRALIPYIAAGDPDLGMSVEIMRAMADAGADIIELGIPFSDPMADGPVIQRAAERALGQGVGLAEVLGIVVNFRRTHPQTPVVLMGYANPIERYGSSQFVTHAKAAGVDGVLVVDYPPEECKEFALLLRAEGLDPIFLLAPTSSDARMEQLAPIASGYVYYVSLRGVTGAAHLDISAVADMVPRIKRHIRVPVGVGFGIRDAQTAQAVARVSDAVVIGSALVQYLEQQPRAEMPHAAARFIAEIRHALDA